MGLIAEEAFPAVGVFGQFQEALGESAVLFLRARHLEIGIAKVAVHEIDGFGVAGMVQAGGEKSAFQAGGAQEVLLSDGDAFDGAKLLAIDRLVDGDQVGAEVGDVVEAFEEGDGEVGGGEAAMAGVAGGSGFAIRGARPGGAAGIGLIGGDLFG